MDMMGSLLIAASFIYFSLVWDSYFMLLLWDCTICHVRCGKLAHASAESHLQWPPLTTTSTGNYRWIASYSGDANNSAAAGACNLPSENTVVSKATS